MSFDVAIIGGGPGGSTAACVLKKYVPNLRVGVFEREAFPRDHVGESQLPPICAVLDEIGCWDKVEAAGFAIKIGATYKWGATPELWDFEFLPHEKFREQARPARYEGQRRYTAFQVDRSIYDKILLDHAIEMGAEVFQPKAVRQVLTAGDRVTGLQLDDGEKVEARYYVDASGHSGLLRRAMKVEIDCPTSLQNIALWDYWRNAEWAVHIGIGGTRIQIISVAYGWIWFIPLTEARTSVGLVVPASYYKEAGLKPEDLYRRALGDDPMIVSLMKNANCEGKFTTTKDWSFLSDRVMGENWFLVGESAGFADPILSAGLTMAQVGAMELACTIFELDRKEYPADWLKEQFSQRQKQRILNHMRFADYWYSANEQFKDLKLFTAGLAKDSGLDLDPDNAWQWLGVGGFINEDEEAGTGGFSIQQIKQIGSFLNDMHPSNVLSETNEFRLNLDGAQVTEKADYGKGRISVVRSYRREDKQLPLNKRTFGLMVRILEQCSHWPEINKAINQSVEDLRSTPDLRTHTIYRILQAFEAMVLDGWVTATYNPDLPLQDMRLDRWDIRRNTDQQILEPKI